MESINLIDASVNRTDAFFSCSIINDAVMRHSFSFNKAFLDNFRRSSALQRLAEERDSLAAMMKAESSKIVPVARVARILDVSVRLLWKWIDQGWVTTCKRPSEHYRKGISKPAFTRFLNRLIQYQEQAQRYVSPVPRGRPATARMRLRKAYLAGQVSDGMTAEQCASALGISTDSVLRTWRKGWVRSFKISACRSRLGDRSKAKRAKKKLTADSAK